MRNYLWIGMAMIAVLTLAACTTPRSTWESVPGVVQATAETADVQLKPLKLDKPYFVGFELTLHNKTAAALEINWNQTRYLHGRKDLGILIFPGVKPEDVKNKTIPNEVVAAGQILVKRISPVQTIAWTPERMITSAEESSITAGILPNGSNSVSLSLFQNGQTWRQILTVRIVENNGQ